jgi:predicted DNA-binding transcriptional regulator YafY
MPLNELEINQLRTAATIISQFKGMPQFEWVNELIPKLKQGIASNEAASTIIEFENNQYLKGIDRLGSLHNAIFYKKVLEIAYQPYENEIPFNLIFHPYFLKQYNSRWFLFGYNPERGKYDWNLAIDRIVDLKETNIKYQKNSAINWQEYFDDIIGVTKPESAEIENITLHFLGKTGKYLETKPLHGSQKSRWLSTNVLEVKLSLIANYELEHLLLSYADSVKIMGPKNLQSKIIKRLSDAASIYDQKLSKSPQV